MRVERTRAALGKLPPDPPARTKTGCEPRAENSQPYRGLTRGIEPPHVGHDHAASPDAQRQRTSNQSLEVESNDSLPGFDRALSPGQLSRGSEVTRGMNVTSRRHRLRGSNPPDEGENLGTSPEVESGMIADYFFGAVCRGRSWLRESNSPGPRYECGALPRERSQRWP